MRPPQPLLAVAAAPRRYVPEVVCSHWPQVEATATFYSIQPLRLAAIGPGLRNVGCCPINSLAFCSCPATSSCHSSKVSWVRVATAGPFLHSQSQWMIFDSNNHTMDLIDEKLKLEQVSWTWGALERKTSSLTSFSLRLGTQKVIEALKQVVVAILREKWERIWVMATLLVKLPKKKVGVERKRRLFSCTFDHVTLFFSFTHDLDLWAAERGSTWHHSSTVVFHRVKSKVSDCFKWRDESKSLSSDFRAISYWSFKDQMVPNSDRITASEKHHSDYKLDSVLTIR